MQDHMLLLYDRSTIGRGGGDAFGVFYDKLYNDSNTYKQCLMPIKNLTEVRDKVNAYLGRQRYIKVLIVHGHGKEGLIGAGGGWRSGPVDAANTITAKTLDDGQQKGLLAGIAKELVTALPAGHYPPIILFTSCESGLKPGGSPDYDFAAQVSGAFEGCVVLLARGATSVSEVPHAYGTMFKIAKCNDQGAVTGPVTLGYFVPGYLGMSGWTDIEQYLEKPFPYNSTSFEGLITL
jgi:hypothetical protein